ncbi:MAG: symmetrical bis(5'-nucleosyl)-tetraphosphatase [Betaproteobacteria bacterium]|nr:symmetrical bis(5'-nucleosyl)-tetraphosphatase [Betaproteobacteria bacterium]
MALYLIGDIQGCNLALGELADKIQFSPSRDTLYLLGDLVNRGPDNVGVLRRLQQWGSSAKCVLGNHDLNLLGIHLGVRRQKPGDTVDDILQAPDRLALIEWIRHQALAIQYREILMVHAGVLPQWTAHQTLALAAEVSNKLTSPDWVQFVAQMYGNLPAKWDDSLQGIDRLRVIVNALTRLRFCTPEGEMEFEHHGPAEKAPPGYIPWFDTPDRRTANRTVAFGHWSSLKDLKRTDVWALDSGCVWGRCLTAFELHAHGLGLHQPIHVNCQDKR